MTSWHSSRSPASGKTPRPSASGRATRVHVRVPATSANIGPGFDALGMALTLYDDVEMTATGDGDGEGLSIEVSGEGADSVDRGEKHLVVRAMSAAFDRLGSARPAGLRLRCVNRIPHGRGLGSSAAAIVAGLLGARALCPDADLDDDDLFALATEIEGHPDNVAACLAGGLTIAWQGANRPRLTRLEVSRQVVAYVPDRRLSTETARGLLPADVPHAAAAANAGRAALLVAALTQGLPPDILLDATVDRLHQTYRAPAMPESATLVDRLRARGIPAVISGAGPTVLAFTTASQVDSTGTDVGNGWHIHPLNVDPYGACVRLAGS